MYAAVCHVGQCCEWGIHGATSVIDLLLNSKLFDAMKELATMVGVG